MPSIPLCHESLSLSLLHTTLCPVLTLNMSSGWLLTCRDIISRSLRALWSDSYLSTIFFKILIWIIGISPRQESRGEIDIYHRSWLNNKLLLSFGMLLQSQSLTWAKGRPWKRCCGCWGCCSCCGHCHVPSTRVASVAKDLPKLRRFILPIICLASIRLASGFRDNIWPRKHRSMFALNSKGQLRTSHFARDKIGKTTWDPAAETFQS